MPKSVWKPSRLIRGSVALHLLAVVVVVSVPAYWPWVLATLIANHILLTLLGLWPRSQGLGPNWTRLPAGARARREIALTIDDGPDPEVTPQTLDILDRYQARATFFCVGDKAARHPELCREIVRRGHAVENHSQRHCHSFALWGGKGFRRELETAQQTLTGITGERPLFFRAPAGMRNPLLDRVLAHLDLRLASWSVRAFDTRSGNVERVRERLLSGLVPGAILLLHDGNAARTRDGVPVIVDVLPALLSAAAAARLQPVTLRQALA